MTPAVIDETDLELLLDMEVLDSRIEAEAEEQLYNKGRRREFVYIDQIL